MPCWKLNGLQLQGASNHNRLVDIMTMVGKTFEEVLEMVIGSGLDQLSEKKEYDTFLAGHVAGVYFSKTLYILWQEFCQTVSE